LDAPFKTRFNASNIRRHVMEFFALQRRPSTKPRDSVTLCPEFLQGSQKLRSNELACNLQRLLHIGIRGSDHESEIVSRLF